MKLNCLLFSSLLGFATAQSMAKAPYTDPKSGITFNAFTDTSGYFFGLALSGSNSTNSTGSTDSTDFIATIGGKGTGWSGVSLGGGMTNKLLIVAWPNGDSVVGSFRKASGYSSPAVVNGTTFKQTPIAKGTYVNSTHWTYTFLCSQCIQSDQTTFTLSDNPAVLGYAFSSQGPQQKSDPASPVGQHSAQGQMLFDLSQAKSADFDTWKGLAVSGLKRHVRRAKFVA